MSGRPSPRTVSRAVPPPSGSLGMSPSDCTINISNGIAVASKQNDRRPSRSASPGPDAAVPSTAAVRLPSTDSQRAHAAPKTTSKTATGKPNRATRPHAAPRMDAAAIRNRRKQHETMARRNRKRRRDHSGRRVWASRPPPIARSKRREQSKGSGWRGADSRDQAQKRRQPGGPQPSPIDRFLP